MSELHKGFCLPEKPWETKEREQRMRKRELAARKGSKMEMKIHQAIALYTAIEALMRQFEEENGDAQVSELSDYALKLCHEIEKLPSSDQQTKVSMMAANILRVLTGQSVIPLVPLCPKCKWHHDPKDDCVDSSRDHDSEDIDVRHDTSTKIANP